MRSTVPEAGSGFELDIFIRARIGEHRNQAHARDRRPWPGGTQKRQLPNGDEARFIVQLLLDLMQQGFPLLGVELDRLLSVPRIDFRVFNPRLRTLAVGEGFQASGRISERTTPLEGQVFEGLFSVRSLVRGALHWSYLGANAHGAEIVDQRFNHARVDAIDAAVPGVEAIGIASLLEQLPGFVRVIRVRLERQGILERPLNDAPRQY